MSKNEEYIFLEKYIFLPKQTNPPSGFGKSKVTLLFFRQCPTGMHAIINHV